MTERDAKRADASHAGIGMQARKFPGCDIDLENESDAKSVQELAEQHLGTTCIRGREGSARRLLIYRLTEGQEPLRKVRIEWEGRGVVEILGAGQYYNISGLHPSGKPYVWDKHPCVDGPTALPAITHEQVAAFVHAVEEYGDLMGFKIAVRGAKIGTTGARKPIGSPELMAADPRQVLAILKACSNENNDYLEFITLLAAVKASLGEAAEDFYPIVEDFALTYPENTPEFVREKWLSIKDAAVGYSYVEAFGRSHGYSTAETDFDDDPPKEFLDDAASDPAGGNVARKNGKPIVAVPFTLPDPANIPRREFLYGGHYVRGFLSTTTAPGGLGKSALAVAESLAMVTQKNLLGEPLSRSKLRVWYHNGEDPKDELDRKFSAAAIHYNLTPDDIGSDRLFVTSGRDTEIIIARDERGGGTKIAMPVVEALIAEIREKQIDVLIIDPFVASHAVSENDNNKINTVCRQFAMIAEKTGCAIELIHHVRKSAFGQGEFTVDDARGASALLAAVRSARTLNFMSKDEAEKAGIEKPRLYFRVDNGKANLAPPSDKSTWRRHVNVQLGNGEEIPHAGDSVGVVTWWQYPDPAEDVTAADIRAVQDNVAGGDWRESPQAKVAWVGNTVADALGLDLGEPGARAKVKALVRRWLQDGVLKLVKRKDAKRMTRTFVEVGKRVAA